MRLGRRRQDAPHAARAQFFLDQRCRPHPAASPRLSRRRRDGEQHCPPPPRIDAQRNDAGTLAIALDDPAFTVRKVVGESGIAERRRQPGFEPGDIVSRRPAQCDVHVATREPRASHADTSPARSRIRKSRIVQSGSERRNASP